MATTDRDAGVALVNAAEDLLTFLEGRFDDEYVALAAMGLVITALLPDADEFAAFIKVLERTYYDEWQRRRRQHKAGTA
jgi:hypothetical protein